MGFRINYKYVLGCIAVIIVIVFILIHNLMKTSVYSEEYSPLEDYDKTIDILWSLTISIEKKSEVKPTVIYDLNIVSDNLSRYRNEAMYRTGLNYRDFYTIDTYVNVTKADREMLLVSHTLPSTWLRMVESIDLLGSNDVLGALSVYHEVKATVIYMIDKLNASANLLRDTRYKEYAVKESHIVKIDEACRVINETISLLEEYVKLMEIIEKTRIKVAKGGNVTESVMKMVEEIKNKVDVSQIEKLSPAIHDFIERASKNPEGVMIEKEARETTITYIGGKSGGYGEEVYDD